MSAWEYLVVEGHRSADQVQRDCTRLGAEGWELAATSPILVQYDQGGFGTRATDTDWIMIFKRRAN